MKALPTSNAELRSRVFDALCEDIVDPRGRTERLREILKQSRRQS